MQQVLIAGASGFLGSFFKQRLEAEGYMVHSLGRSGPLCWEDKDAIVNTMEQCDTVINLCGHAIGCRHTPENKRLIVESRVQSTRDIATAMQLCRNAPRLWINAGGNTIYPRSYDKAYTEYDPTGDDCFMYQVCKAWEDAFFQPQLPNTRRVVLRTGIVLAASGGIMDTLVALSRRGLGGTVGSGRQMMSWIHIEDAYGILKLIMTDRSIEGPVNLAAPEPLSNREFMRTLRRALKVPIGLPAPAWLVRLTAPITNTEPYLALDSYYTISKVLPQHGYQFRFPDLKAAFADFFK